MGSSVKSELLLPSVSQTLFSPLQTEGMHILEGILEASLDTKIEDELLRNIPFLSAAVSLVRINSGIERWFMIKKLANFISQINDSVSEDDRNNYIKRFTNQNQKDHNKELEYLLVIINRYITVEQPRYLAKVYLSFLQGNISFPELALFSKILDSMLPNDMYVLINDSLPEDQGNVLRYSDYIKRLRLNGLIEVASTERTSLGKTLYDIMQQ